MQSTSNKLEYYVACFQKPSKCFSALCKEMRRGSFSNKCRVAPSLAVPMCWLGISRRGCMMLTLCRSHKPLPQVEFLLASWGLCAYVMQSVTGRSCAPHRVAATFSPSTIDSKKKIRYTVPHLDNRFFDNRNSDSCPLSESS